MRLGLWAPLEREAIRRFAPARPGVYRIRHEGGEPKRLVYVGQTGRTLRERLLLLAAGTNAGSGDKVMQIENDYDKEVYNGDLGVVRSIDPDASEMVMLQPQKG